MTTTATGLHLTVPVSTLAAAVAKVARVVPARTNMPVLAGILFDAGEGGLTLTATNLEAGVRVKIPAEVMEPGAVVVPAKLLQGALAGLPDEALELTLDLESLSLRLRCARTRATIRCLSAEDFPPGPRPEGGERFTVDLDALVAGIGQTAPFASTAVDRPVFTAVLFRIGEEGLTLAGADAHRVSVRELDIYDAEACHDGDLLVPARVAAEVPRVLKGESGTVEVMISAKRNQVWFRLNGAEVAVRLIDGAYPTFRQVIPTKWTTEVQVSTEALKQALTATTAFAAGDSAGANLRVSPDGFVISAATVDVGDSEIEVDANVTGDEIVIRLNVQYLLDVLAVVGERVAIRLNRHDQPVLIVDPADSGFTHVVMPVRKAGVS